MVESKPKNRNNLRRKASDPCDHTQKALQPRARIQSSPACPMIDRPKIQNDSRFTEAAKELSDEELANQYEINLVRSFLDHFLYCLSICYPYWFWIFACWYLFKSRMCRGIVGDADRGSGDW